MLSGDLSPAQLPRHVAIIMDGNGRWARKRYLPREAGHLQGVKSVREVVRGVEQVTGKALPVQVSPRRLGDPPTLIADPSRIKAALGWKPAHDGIEEIIASAIAWEKRFNR